MKEKDAKNEDMSNLPYETVKKAKKMGADDVVCSLYKLERYQIRFSNNLPTTSNFSTNYEIWVFLSKDGKTTSFELSDNSQLDDMLKKGLKELEVVSENKNYAGIAKGPFKYKERKYDEKIVELGEKSVELVESAIEGALAEGAERTAGVLYANGMQLLEM
ncbi:MAG: DNA gyrase modulator [Thermoplasmata archaeon]